MKVVALVVAALCAASPVNAGEQRFDSPNGRRTVCVVGIGKQGFVDQESRIVVRDRSGRPVAVKAFASADGEHGFGLRRASWTPRGRWFLFSLNSSGGHQPWHVLTYAYDSSSHRFYDLDDYVGPVMSDFELSGNDAVIVTRMNPNSGVHDERVRLRLSRMARSR